MVAEKIKTIVCIDDHEQDIKLLQRVIERELKNINLITYNDSETAIEQIMDGTLSQYNPSLLFIDIKMPKISGFDILQTLRQDKNYQTVPKIVLSSSAQKSDIKQAFDLSCNSYIAKPTSFPKFKETIIYAITYWLSYNLRLND